MQIQCLALLFALFACGTTFAQGGGKVSMNDISFMTFNAENNNDWNIKTFGATVADGRHVLATHKKTKTQVIAIVRGGKIAEIGYIPVGGTYKALLPASSPCLSGGFCYSFQAKNCYYVQGVGCVCVCGAFVANTGSN